jgi:hypothetical protein
LPDLLVKLYGLPDLPDTLSNWESKEIHVRPAMAYEKRQVIDWVDKHFGGGWASECDVAFSNRPISCHLATENGVILGFACYDTTARGMFGPFGVAEVARGRGVGRALLLCSLHAMKMGGYAYAVIGGVGSVEFYRRVVDVMEIPNSSPGIYSDRLAE